MGWFCGQSCIVQCMLCVEVQCMLCVDVIAKSDISESEKMIVILVWLDIISFIFAGLT